MKKRMVFLLYSFIILIGCSWIIIYGAISFYKQRTSIQEFIIGQWAAEFQVENYGIISTEIYQIEFISKDNLILNKKTQNSTFYNYIFDYRFIDENHIEVQSRIIDKWELTQINGTLYIQSKGNLIKSGIFHRKPVILWGMVAFIIGVLFIGIFIKTLLPDLQKRQLLIKKGFSSSLRQWMNSKLLNKFFILFADFSLMALGFLLSKYLWNNLLFRTIRIPWDAVISIELGLAILILGLKIIINNESSKYISLSTAIFRNSVGMVVIGCSSAVLIYGFIGIIVFLYVGHYPFG